MVDYHENIFDNMLYLWIYEKEIRAYLFLTEIKF
jgi:hypothetical protein